MIFAPHILEKLELAPIERDEFGRPIKAQSEGKWVKVGSCRCSMNGSTERTSNNGERYTPTYHIVCDKTEQVKAGDNVRCLDKQGNIVGKGVISSIPKTCTFYRYTDLYI